MIIGEVLDQLLLKQFGMNIHLASYIYYFSILKELGIYSGS